MYFLLASLVDSLVSFTFLSVAAHANGKTENVYF